MQLHGLPVVRRKFQASPRLALSMLSCLQELSLQQWENQLLSRFSNFTRFLWRRYALFVVFMTHVVTAAVGSFRPQLVTWVLCLRFPLGFSVFFPASIWLSTSSPRVATLIRRTIVTQAFVWGSFAESGNFVLSTVSCLEKYFCFCSFHNSILMVCT